MVGMRTIIEDVRYGLRLLRKSPVFTGVAIATLALGIGANTAIFTLLDQVLLRGLPVKEPDRLALLRYSGLDSGHSRTRADDHFYFSYPMYRDLRDHNSVFSGLIATAWARVGAQWHNEPELADAEMVSGNYFDVLGLQPALGRLLVPSDDAAVEGSPVAVLAFDYWQRRFGSDPHILNQSISINGRPFVVVGVAPPGFHSAVGGDDPGLFVPISMEPQITPPRNDLEVRRSKWLNILGRLKPEFTRHQAQAGVDPLWHSIRTDELAELGHSSDRFKEGFLTESHLLLDEGAKGVPVHRAIPITFLVVAGMTVLMILLACTNVASLLLVRMASRTREISVRYALGATRRRVVAQLLAEGMLLGLAGGAVALVLAPQVSPLLLRILQSGSGRGSQLAFSSRFDLRALAFNFGVALLVSTLFSLAPVLQFWHPDVSPALKQQAATSAVGSLWLRRTAVVAQISLTLLLLLGGGLFVRTLHNLTSVDMGFATDHLVTFRVDSLLAGYQADQSFELYQRTLNKLAGLPGVRSAAATSDPELANHNSRVRISVAGHRPSENEDMNVEWEWVSQDYESTLKIPLLAGRQVTNQDRAGTAKVAVVNASFARHFFGQPQKAIGQYFGEGAGEASKTDIQIVGVVDDAKHTTVRSDIGRTVFTPCLQDTAPGTQGTSGMTFYVRTWQEPENAEATIRQAMQALDSRLVLNGLRTMQEQVDANLTNERAIAFLATTFGVLAALMAAIGIYGVLAYSTAQRTREIGLRIAVGAARIDVVRLVLAEVLWMAGAGIVAGIPVSLLLVRLIRSQLFRVSISDPLTLSVVCLAVTGVALLAATLPARRAAKVDPMVALRYE